jgi:hypothetical protein
LPPEAYKNLEHLAEPGFRGSTPNEITRHPILRELDNLARVDSFSGRFDQGSK